MARQREFDADEALDKAMILFWEKGYDETSVRDLVDHTGVAHAGLYSAFGDKEKLFEAALDRYYETVIQPNFSQLMHREAGRDTIIGFFDKLLELSQSSAFRNGCLFCNSITEIGGGNAQIALRFKNVTALARKGFVNALKNARAAGDISDDIDIDGVAEYFVTLFQGLAVRARAGASAEELKRAITGGLSILK